MPAAAKDQPVVIALDPKTPEWNVVEALRNKFVTPVVDTKNGQPKLTKEGVQQVRRASGAEIVERVVSTILLNASEETISALASEAKDKVSAAGKAPKYKTKDFIESIIASRNAAKSGAVDLSKLSDEELAAEMQRREAAKKGNKGG